MIEAAPQPDFASLAAALERQARALGQAAAEAAQLARTGPAAAWRRADLLWPLFTKG